MAIRVLRNVVFVLLLVLTVVCARDARGDGAVGQALADAQSVTFAGGTSILGMKAAAALGPIGAAIAACHATGLITEIGVGVDIWDKDAILDATDDVLDLQARAQRQLEVRQTSLGECNPWLGNLTLPPQQRFSSKKQV